MNKFLLSFLVLWFSVSFAQVSLEFAPAAGSKVSPAALRDARNVLQHRLESFLKTGQPFNVTPGARTLLVRLESSNIDIETLIDLCTAVGKLEFVDSGVALEEGDTKPEGNVIFTEQDILTASASISELGEAVVELELTPEGTEKLAAYSKDNVGRFLVIAKDDLVLSSPVLRSEILGGKVWIQGNFTLEEARGLAAAVTIRLPFPLTLVRQY
jgi:preprotein translocase subunit SecD